MSPSLLCAFALKPCDFLFHLLYLLLLLSGIGSLLTLLPLLDGSLLLPSSKARRGAYSPLCLRHCRREGEAPRGQNSAKRVSRGPCMQIPLRLCHLSPLSLIFFRGKKSMAMAMFKRTFARTVGDNLRTSHMKMWGFEAKRARKFTRTSPRTLPWNFITMLSATLNFGEVHLNEGE